MRGESVKLSPSFKHDTKHIGMACYLLGVQGCSVSLGRDGFIQKKNGLLFKNVKGSDEVK